MNFEFKNGVGKGTCDEYYDEYSFEGSIVITGWEIDKEHGWCTETYKDGEVYEYLYNRGRVEHAKGRHLESDWKWESKGTF